ncbi:MAG: thioredoxin-disulfide reductase [Rickettsiales bacterium]|nr:thioredoxin-disulfide reductase [Rickettsiales bacterium]|tara:strand:+ start:2830 stop:3777 length:948 start_codon:yes stop_codon:yes gene_type:complete
MTKTHKSKILIVGSGSAGYTAAIYAARANLEPILVSGIQPGGQLTITTEVENFPGFAEAVQGPWLMEQMEQQARNVGTTIINDHIKEVDFSGKIFSLIGESQDIYQANSVIIATGAQAKWLGLESETKFQGFGVSGCATCDGFFFKNKNVIVVGGGNTAVEEALYLTNHCAKVYLVHRRDTLRAEKIAQERLFKNSKIELIWNSTLEEIIGNDNPKYVTAAKLKNTISNEITEIAIDGVFIAIGHKPNSDIFKNTKLKIDEEGYLITNPDSTSTNIAGIYAAGDIQDKIYRQAVTAAGSGCMAALEAEKYLAQQE